MKQADNRLVFILLFLVIATYSNSVFGDFLYDDHTLIVQNPFIRSFQYLPQIFSSGFGRLQITGANYFRPLQEFTYMLDYFLWKDNKFGYHVTSLWFLLGAVLLLFALLKHLFKDNRLAFFTSLLLGVHPIYTSAVTYISGRADIMAVFFLLCSGYLLVKNIDCSMDKWPKILFTSGGFFLLALLSKEISFVFIVVMIVCFVFCKNEISVHLRRARFIHLVLLFASIIFCYGLLRAYALKTVFHSQYNIALPATVRILTAVKAFYNYLQLLLFPINLHLGRTIPLVKSVFEYRILCSLFIFVIMGYLIFRLRKTKGPGFYGLLWFFIWYLPISNLIVPLNSFVAENWIQLPALGIFLAVSALILKISQIQEADNPLLETAKRSIISFFWILIFFYAGLTIYRNWQYSDPIVYFQHAIAQEPTSAKLYNNLGQEYSRRNKMEEALRVYKQALEIHPHDINLLNCMANTYLKQARYDEAVTVYKRTIALAPKDPMLLNNLGIAYIVKGDRAKALYYWDRSLRINPDQPEIKKYIKMNK
ncbi:MAG: tetratricopeptide repeat protein [Candidatus Omnitrophica bacterium]|nr:tetratricopeptide repeat protein [Candidatus Omnitrophota bacterium]